jgi:hypothetical protein
MSINLPPWPDEASPEGRRFFASARALLASWKARGVGNPYALAMIAQGEAETILDPNATGDWVDADGKRLPWAPAYPPGAKPTSFGLYQWKDDRLAAIRKGAGVDIKESVMLGQATLADAVDGAAWELAPSGPFAEAGKNIAAQMTAYMAAYEAAVLFERASAADAATRRANMAERWAAWFGKHPSTSSG